MSRRPMAYEIRDSMKAYADALLLVNDAAGDVIAARGAFDAAVLKYQEALPALLAAATSVGVHCSGVSEAVITAVSRPVNPPAVADAPAAVVTAIRGINLPPEEARS